MRAGHVGAGQPHGVEGEPMVVEAGGVEAQPGVGAENRVAAQVLMDGDA